MKYTNKDFEYVNSTGDQEFAWERPSFTGLVKYRAKYRTYRSGVQERFVVCPVWDVRGAHPTFNHYGRVYKGYDYLIFKEGDVWKPFQSRPYYGEDRPDIQTEAWNSILSEKCPWSSLWRKYRDMANTEDTEYLEVK